jgi:predicted DNA-binding transcriptional regulator AlpA
MEKDAYNILEFCQRHGISRSAFYKAIEAGQAPRLMHLGSRILVSKEAAEAWRRDREQASEQPAVGTLVETTT